MIFSRDINIVLYLSVVFSFHGESAEALKKSPGLTRILLDHQSKFDKMHFLKNGRRLDTEEEGGCIRSSIGDTTTTQCFTPEGDISTCVVKSDGSCEYNLLSLSSLEDLADDVDEQDDLSAEALAEFLEDLFGGLSNTECECESQTPDCSAVDENYSENACTVDPDISFDCDENSQCCKVKVDLEGELTEIECCAMTDEDKNSVESKCCITIAEDGKTCSGSSFSCPDGFEDAGFDYSTCSCSIEYQNENCKSCNWCSSDKVGMDNGIEYDCSNIDNEWKMTCDDSSALELETFSRNGGGSSPDASKLFLFPGVSDATATNGSADGPGSSAFNCNPVGVAVAIVPALVGFVAIF